MGAPYINQASKLSLLGLIQQACGELGISQPTQIFGNTDNQVVQLLALAKRCGKDLYNRAQRAGGWEELRGQQIINVNGFSVDGSGNTITGNIVAGSNQITNVSYIGSVAAPSSSGSWVVQGINLPWDCNITGVSGTGPYTLTLDQEVQSTVTGEALTFGQVSYALPSDYGYLMTQTSWDRSFRWQLLGPIEAQEWQVLKSGISPTGPRLRFRIFNNLFWIDPPQMGYQELVYEYYSNSWCQSSAAAAQTTWAADTDYFSLDDDMFMLELQWRWKAKKGLDFTQDKADADLLIQRLMARTGGNRDLPLNAQASGIRLLNEQNIPDTGFGS